MQRDLAPIVLFIYNRPEHTLKTLEALQKNNLASESILFVFADGPKEHASKEDLLKIKAARDVVKSGNWCKEVRLVESQQNKGLADSIITGVTKVVNIYGKVIVLEDDLVSSVGFLQYMNEALKLYKEDEKVMHVAAHIFETDFNLPETFFYNSASCWGWGTWSRAWKYLNTDAKQLLEELKKHPNYLMFDLGRGYLDQLEGNISGTINTWAIKWNTSVFLNNGLCLHPNKSLTNNIGVGRDATNTINMDSRIINQKPIEYINVERIALEESKTIYRALKKYFSNDNQAMLNKIKNLLRKPTVSVLRKIKLETFTRNLINSFNLHRETSNQKKKFIAKHGKEFKGILNYLSINGWLTDKEAIALYKLPAQLQKTNPIVVEIGSWLGKSSFLLAKGLKENSVLPRLYCIDPFNAAGDLISAPLYEQEEKSWLQTKNLSLKEQFIINMKQNKTYDIITVLEGYSSEFASTFDQKIDLLFIDGNHDYDAVLKDYSDWSGFIKGEGIIAFHDVEFDPMSEPTGQEEFLGPGLVIKHKIINNPDWYNCQRVDNLFYAFKRG